MRFVLLVNLIIFTFFVAAPSAMAKNQLKKVVADKSDTQLKVEITFEKPVKKEDVKLEFIRRTIQIDMSNSIMDVEKNIQRIDKGDLRSVFTYQAGVAKVRSRIIYDKDVDVKKFEGRTKIEIKGNTIYLVVGQVKAVAGATAKTAAQSKGLRLPPKSLGDDLDEQLRKLDAEIAEQDKTKTPAKKAAISKPKAFIEKVASKSTNKIEKITGKESSEADRKESEIPLFSKKTTSEVKESGAIGRLAISLVVVILMGLGLVIVSKWWGKRHKGNELDAKMRVVSQFHLGPKKSLAIVRVAGESILLGVTDHNISMIKTLSLIDDELPDSTESTSTSFEDSLNKLVQENAYTRTTSAPVNYASTTATPSEQSMNEDVHVGSIREAVSNKLKKMRTL